jgi:dihydropteroate synthase
VSESRLDAPAEKIRWRVGSREIVLDRPIIVGILNVTPDSFSDGGNFFSYECATTRAEQIAKEGADVIDIGGESTRPGSVPVDSEEEIRRVIPVIEAIAREIPDIAISIDTWKSGVARAGLDAGASIVNDVSGLRFDTGMAPLLGGSNCGVILMHSRGPLGEIASYKHAEYGEDVAAEVARELKARAEDAIGAGVRQERIVLDPGIGFSKRTEHSLSLLRDLDPIQELGFPVLVGVSRKRTIADSLTASGRTSEITLENRDAGTVAANIIALNSGAMLFRVHNVAMNRAALDVAWQIVNATA